MLGLCKRFFAWMVILVFSCPLAANITASAAPDVGAMSIGSTVYEMEVGSQTTADNYFSNIVVIRPSEPGIYEISLQTIDFEPYLVVYRGEEVIGYHTPGVGASSASLELVLEDGLVSRNGGVVFTVVAASRVPGESGPVTLQITPEVELLSPRTAFGVAFLSSFGRKFDELLMDARANDSGTEITYVELPYGAGMQIPTAEAPMLQTYAQDYSEPAAIVLDSQMDMNLYALGDGSISDAAGAGEGGEPALTSPIVPTFPAENPVVMAPQPQVDAPPFLLDSLPPVAMAPAPQPSPEPPSGLSGAISGLTDIIAAIEPASSGVDVAAGVPEQVVQEPETSSETGGRGPASIVATSAEPAPHWREFLLPDFKPWPPPKPTTSVRINRALYTPFLDVETANYGDVSGLLETALNIGGYERFAYFGVPGGFALVTQLEQIQENGEPVDPPTARWHAAIAGPRPFDLATYIHRLFFARIGYYRVLVFTVLADPITPGGDTLTEDPDWIGEGATGLPRILKEARFTQDHDVTVLVYEFERHEVEPEPKFRGDDDSPLSASDHLRGAKFSSYFNDGRQ